MDSPRVTATRARIGRDADHALGHVPVTGIVRARAGVGTQGAMYAYPFA